MLTQAPEQQVQLLDLPQPALATILTQLDSASAVHLAQSSKRVRDVFVGCQQEIAARTLDNVLGRVRVAATFNSNLSPAGNVVTQGPVRITVTFHFPASEWKAYMALLSTGISSPAVSQLIKQGASAVAGLTRSKEPFLPPSNLSWQDCLAKEPDVWGAVGVEAALEVPPSCSSWFYGNFDRQLDVLSAVFGSFPETAFAEQLDAAGACLLRDQRKLRRLSVACRGGFANILTPDSTLPAAAEAPVIARGLFNKPLA